MRDSKIIQIMPATAGIRVWACTILRDGAAEFSEVPVIGWALVSWPWPEEDGKGDDTSVELLVYWFEEATSLSTLALVETKTSFRQFTFGSEPTKRDRDEMEAECRERKAAAERSVSGER